MNGLRKKWLTLPLCLALVFILAACGEDENENQEPNQEEDSFTVAEMEVIDRDEDEVTADTHDGHWHGSLPVLEVDGNRLSLGANFLDEDDEAIDIDYDHYTFDARFAPGENEDLIEIESHGDHIHLRPGSETGDTAIIFELKHHDEVVYEAPLITVIVSDGEHGHDDDFEVDEVELLARGEGTELAEYHGGHWHGSLTVAVGEEIGVDVRFLDDHGHELTLGGDYRVDARLADGANDGVIAIDAHGDHLDIEGIAEGTTQIIIELIHNDHVEWETSVPVDVNVTDGEHSHDDDFEVDEVELLVRGEGTELAHYHDGEWHGSLTVTVGEEVGVDVKFLDDHDEELTLGGDYQVNARLADGADDGIIAIEAHGDHLDIEGIAEGTTQIIIELHHDDHLEWETSVAIDVTVEAAD